jgi:peptidoglycan hydrolase CwlO-like protein
LAATPIAEIEQLIAELQQAKAHLQSECERLEQETARYVSLTQLASETTTLISDSISQWHPARSDQRSQAHTLSPAVELDGTVSGN